ncbi:MAG: AIR synthase-related protein [Planctomycetota bacterium]
MTEPSQNSSLYNKLGASSDKQQVHRAIKSLPPSLYPGAFCRIVPDVFTGSPDKCLVSHSDSAGTKCIVGYLAFKEWDDAGWLSGLSVDATVMNLDDMACVGAVGPFVLSNTIARNFRLVGEEGIKAVIDGYVEFAALMEKFGIVIAIAGGETEDLGDVVRTLSVGATMSCITDRANIIDNSNIKAGDLIAGFSSTGRAIYESAPNSGIASNGFTLARHRLLNKEYLKKYPEIADPGVPQELAYNGRCDLDTPVPGLHQSVGEALLSPTRTYAPFVAELLKEVGPANISGIIHNTGGGQTKNLHFGRSIHYIKDNLFPVPPLFEFIRTHGEIPLEWREMYQVFNMGHRLEVFGRAEVVERAISIAETFGIAGRIVGRCENSLDGSNTVSISAPDGKILTYKR